MKVIESVEEFKDPRQPLVLTIGNFDGMHRGHAALLKKMQELARVEGQTLVITFRNHPTEILRPDQPIKRLTTLEQRLQLLHSYPIDYVLLINFTTHLAQHSAAFFIESLRQSIPFSDLVLGHDATLGRDKQGDRATLQELGDLWGFSTFYVDEYRYEAKAVSSTRIREALQQGDLSEVEALLNRPYSILLPTVQGPDPAQTFLLDAATQCLPPSGAYAIEMHSNSKPIEGIAIIKPGKNQETLLELELAECYPSSETDRIEIVFKQVIHFSDVHKQPFGAHVDLGNIESFLKKSL